LIFFFIIFIGCHYIFSHFAAFMPGHAIAPLLPVFAASLPLGPRHAD
jgi:hypothetical protein